MIYGEYRIFTSYKDIIKVSLIPELAAKKCMRKNLPFNGYGDIFTSNLIQDLNSAWEQWVRPLVADLPAKDLVVQDLKEIFEVKDKN